MRIKYTSKESLEHVQYKFKKKKYDFWKKKRFLEIFHFSSKVGPFDVEIVKKIFFVFQKFQNKIEKWLLWDHSNMNRHKVMNFGGHCPYSVETARLFMVIQAIMAPSYSE